MKKIQTLTKVSLAICFCLVSISMNSQNCSCEVSQVELGTVSPCTEVIGDIVNVSTTQELRAAFSTANNTGGNMTILIADGIYPIASTASYPYITASNLVIRSASGQRDEVIITGQGMQDVSPGTETGLSLQGNNVTVADLTIRGLGNHGISTIGDGHFIHNVRIQDTYEQMIKGNGVGDGADNGIVQCCLLEYTDGIGPQWYIGGLDIHGGNDWIVRDNVFKNIASPSDRLAEHAVHFWSDGGDNLVERNIIVGCDRGVGFGLGASPNTGGIIRNNMIVNDGSHPFDDVGIGLESSPGTEVYNNTIMIDYPNAIEYRFEETADVVIANNITNRLIRSRNGGTADVHTNVTDGQVSWFVDAAAGNLRLAHEESAVVDQGAILNNVSDDIDQQSRPMGNGPDIGAHEWTSSTPVDMDEDGYTADVDCDDENPDVNPGASEIAYNGIDDDCDATTLDDDLDQDGFLLVDDCNDENASINPDATEIVYNGIDEDCNPLTYDDDLDQDGYLALDDCDDENPTVNPDATEIPYNGVDEDCDPATRDDDIDQDGFVLAEDCNDENPDINPIAEEIPYNGVDEDCDPATRDDDLDEDGFVLDEDCNDEDAAVNPDATDIPNNDIDEDCSGQDSISTSIYSIVDDLLLSTYPSPADEFLQLEYIGSNIKISVITNQGAEALSCIDCKILDVSTLPSGLYLVRAASRIGYQSSVDKIVISR